MCKSCIVKLSAVSGCSSEEWHKFKYDWIPHTNKHIKQDDDNELVLKDHFILPVYFDIINDKLVTYDVYDDNYKKYRCICGKHIQKFIMLRNDIHKIICMVGSCCVYTHKKESLFCKDDYVSRYVKNMDKFYCEVCDLNISKRLEKQHKKSYSHNLKLKKTIYRECQKCNLFCVDKNKPENYKYCDECFKDKVLYKHNCIDCKKKKITDYNFKKYGNICYNCKYNKGLIDLKDYGFDN